MDCTKVIPKEKLFFGLQSLGKDGYCGHLLIVNENNQAVPYYFTGSYAGFSEMMFNFKEINLRQIIEITVCGNKLIEVKTDDEKNYLIMEYPKFAALSSEVRSVSGHICCKDISVTTKNDVSLALAFFVLKNDNRINVFWITENGEAYEDLVQKLETVAVGMDVDFIVIENEVLGVILADGTHIEL